MSKRRTIFLGSTLLCLIICVVVLVLVTNDALALARLFPKSPASAGAVPPTTVPQRERGPVLMIRFTLMNDGIFPRELRVKQGLLNVAIEDKTNSTSGLVIHRIIGNGESRVGEIRRFTNHWRGRELIRLVPGQYRVFDSSRPRIQAQLIVEQ